MKFLMKFLKNLTSKQPSSRSIGWLSPMIAFSILGLTSGSVGYYFAVNKTFFQDSKADAAKIPIGKGVGKAVAEGIDSFLSQLKPEPISKEAEEGLKHLLRSRNKLPESKFFTTPKKGKAVPFGEDITAYRVPGVQALENPSETGKALTLSQNEFYNVTDIIRTEDGSFWLKLYSKNPNESVYIDAQRVVCDIPFICLGNFEDLAKNPDLIQYYARKLNSQTPLAIGY